ncbi:MAG: hypothetical protein R2771_14750 [Saprospiraceae bacterium]
MNFGGGANVNYIFSIENNIERYNIKTLKDIYFGYNLILELISNI